LRHSGSLIKSRKQKEKSTSSSFSSFHLFLPFGGDSEPFLLFCVFLRGESSTVSGNGKNVSRPIEKGGIEERKTPLNVRSSLFSQYRRSRSFHIALVTIVVPLGISPPIFTHEFPNRISLQVVQSSFLGSFLLTMSISRRIRIGRVVGIVST